VGTVDAILKWREGRHKAGQKDAHWQPSKFAEFNERVANAWGSRFSSLEPRQERKTIVAEAIV
jgi:autonomous glycyl radical cofactor GrcA